MKKALFIYNQFAGRESLKQNLADILYCFAQAGWEITVRPTIRRGDATRIATGCSEEYDLILCSGGDGTLNETVNGLLRRKGKMLPIGYIPAGSTNDFSVSLGIPKDLKKAAQAVISGKSFFCDIGRLNDQFFCYAAAFGLFTEVSYDTDQNLKNLLGHAAYILEAVRRLPETKTYEVEIEYEDGVIKGDFLFGMICNSDSVGGIKGIAGRDVSLNDGLFEVILVRTPQKDDDLSDTINVLTSGDIIANSKYITTFKTSRLRVRAMDDMPWTVDGEFGGAPALADIAVLPKAIEFIV